MKRRRVILCLALALAASPGWWKATDAIARDVNAGVNSGRSADGGETGMRIETESSGLRETGRDGAMIRYENGIVYDPATRLEWMAGPDQRLDWNEARAWAEGLSVGGGGWRLPTRDELQTLYKEGSGSRNMTSLLQTSGWFIWSSETRDLSTAWIFNFYYNGFEIYDRRSDRRGNRAFAVRSR
jgi:hypothetical protein